MKKKVIAFDLDGTLAESKSAPDQIMADLLSQLLDCYDVCVISGGKFAQFELQLLSKLNVEPAKLERLHLMPTCGTRYFNYDLAASEWKQIYAEDFVESEKIKITEALNQGIDALGMREAKPYGDLIEDRGSQITFSAIGQEAPVDAKKAWDPTGEKKASLRDYCANLLPEFSVRTGGLTSIDITKQGIDKAYGMKKLTELLNITQDEILFIGDAMQEGGNDYPVKAMGIESIAVTGWQDTAEVIRGIIHTAV